MIPNEDLYYMIGGQRIVLNRLNKVKFVSPARDEHIAAVGARLARSSRLSINSNVPHSCLVVQGEESKIEEIRGYRDIASIRSAFSDPNGLEFVLTDEVIVRFSDDLSDIQRRKILGKYACTISTDLDHIWKIRILDDDDDAPLAIANALSEEKGIIFAEPNALQAANFLSGSLPTDSFFKNQWHLRNTGQGGGKKGADVKAIEAWKITQGDPNVRIVVHDSGVDIDHVDLKANIGVGKDFDNDDADASNDNGPHGTACAGVIAARRNGKGVIGIAPKCTISPVRVAGAHTWETWKETFEWAAKHGEVISCSWSISPNNILTEAIRKVAESGRAGKGIPIFFATGNEFQKSIAYPASLPETIAVGASTNKDKRSSYSNYGTGIDFVAPSSGGTRRIETTDVMGDAGYNKTTKGNYCKAVDSTGFGGTSSATPLAAGVAALMLSVNPDLTSEEVRRILQESCVQIDKANASYNGSGWSKEYGYGRIDAAEAVKAAKKSGSTPTRQTRKRSRKSKKA